jgi:serine/threonine-protein kinase RsbT
MDTRETRLSIQNEIDVARAAVEADRCCTALGFDRSRSQMVATAVSELARNIVKYASHGEVILRGATRGTARGIEIVVNDQGPGIEDVDQALRDHFSSSGTLGLGLPGVKRMMDELYIESERGRGTRVTIRKWLQGRGTR